MPAVPSFDEGPRVRASLSRPPLRPPAKEPWPTLSPQVGGLVSHLGRRGGGDGGGLFTPIKVRAPEVTRARRRPGNPPPLPHPLGFTASSSCSWGEAPPRLPPVLKGPALPPRPGLSGRRGAGPGRNSPSSRDSVSLSGKSLCEVCSRPRACGEIQRGLERAGKAGGSGPGAGGV